jgi:hypothetical protein
VFLQDQIMMVPAIKECYRHWGLHGLHYAVLFGWQGSPYLTELDPEKRDILAYDAVRNTELYDYAKEKMAKPDKVTKQMYQNVFVKRAIEAFNALAPVPQLHSRNYFGKQIVNIRKQLEQLKFDTDDVALLQKASKVYETLNKQMKDMNKEMKEIDAEINVMYQAEKLVTLDMLIAAQS